MTEQTTGKLSEGELDAIKARDKEAAELIPEHVVLTRVDPDYRAECYCDLDRRALLGHIAYQAAKIERVERAHASLVADLKTIGDRYEAPTSYHGDILAPAVRLSAFIADLKRKISAALANLRSAGIEATDPATGIHTMAAERAGLQGEVERLTKELHDYKTAATEEAAAHDEARKQLAAANEAANNFENAAGHLADLFWAESEKLAKAEKQIAEIRAAGVGDEELAKRACAAWFGLRADHPDWSQRDHREGWIRSVRAVAAPFRARIAELTKELAAATDKLDALKIDPATREELRAKCYERFEAAYEGEGGRYWRSWSTAFRNGVTNALEHAFAAGRASAPEVAELQRQLEEETNKRIDVDEKLLASQNRAKSLRADRDRLAAELATEKQNHQATAELLGLVAGELGETKQALAKIVDIRSKIFLCDETLDLAIKDAKLLLEKRPAPLTAAEFAELGKVLDAEAADHSGDAAEKVEAPASEARRFVCPECESGPVCWVTVASTEGGTGELRCPECNWTGTWAEAEAAIKIPSTAEQLASIGAGQPPGLENEPEERPWAEAEAAKGEQSQSLECRIRKAYRRLDDPLFESAMDDLLGLERQLADARRECADCEESNDEIFKRFNRVCDQRNGYSGEVELLKQQLAAERQAREAADRQATEKILELERRCNDEHFKWEAAESERDGLKVRLNDLERSPDEKQKSIWELEQMVSDAEERANNIARMLHAEKQRAEQAEAAANELRALRAFRAEIEQDYQAWANATIGDNELRIRLGVARNKVDKAIAGQGEAGKEGR